MIRFPRKWAAAHSMTQDRVELADAIGFVNHVQSLQFGYILEHKAADDAPPAEDDPAMKTEKELQEDLNRVIDRLQTLQQNGQQTISTQKVISFIEDETGYDFEYSQ